MNRSLVLSPGLEPYPGYTLGNLLGKGGWGEVWRAEDASGKPCALKFMTHRNVAAAYEIRALNAIKELRHPNLLGIDKIWTAPGYLVIQMELADGSLHDLLDVYYTELNHPITAEHVCFFLRQAAEAIDFFNTRQHLVNGQRMAFRHCDVKPSNLLLVGETVRLADFSIAFPTGSPMVTHSRAGSLDYAAPEVFRNWYSDRSDQFSLAVTYYQLRTGRLPFPQTKGFSSTYQRPAPDLVGVEKGEERVLLRALSSVPQDRWTSCRDMIAALSVCVSPSMPA
ncbi:MAG: serine/threonine-protein kinase [Gemmataceae bacterium]